MVNRKGQHRSLIFTREQDDRLNWLVEQCHLDGTADNRNDLIRLLVETLEPGDVKKLAERR